MIQYQQAAMALFDGEKKMLIFAENLFGFRALNTLKNISQITKSVWGQ